MDCELRFFHVKGAGGPMEGGGRCASAASSEGGGDAGAAVEQEEIVALTHDVKAFKEALGGLRRTFHPHHRAGVRNGGGASLRGGCHERLGRVLRVLRAILEKYSPLQSTELLTTAGRLIQHVKGHDYEDERADPSAFFEAIDQLALAFSSRVSEYLMGDLDSSSQPVPKTKSCDNLLSTEGECDPFVRDKRFASSLSPQEIDAKLARVGDGVELALRRAKVWSKYAKDVMAYVEKRCSAEAEHARNLVKLAQTMRPILKEESFLPFQSIYYMALDQDYENAQTSLTTCTLLQGHKFMEPLTARRNEHEKYRKQIKDTWHRELKRMHESVSNLRKAKSLYLQRQQEHEKAKEAALRAERGGGGGEGVVEVAKVDRKRRLEDDACQRAMEAETTYKSCVLEANERQLALEKVKGEVLQQVRELIYQCDQTMKAVTVGYFQLQHTISAPAPVQFQTLCESSRLYEPGTQYMEFVKRMPAGLGEPPPFAFEPFSATFHEDGNSRLDKARRSNGSTESCEDILGHSFLEPRITMDSKGAQRLVEGCPVNGDSDSSCQSLDTSPAASPHPSRALQGSSGEELETDHDNVDVQSGRSWLSKAAETHNFRKLKTPSRCRECDSYVYFHGFECFECGLASHRKCLDSLAIQCGRKRLPRKMTTFGIDLTAHANESGDDVPFIVKKCITEIEDKGVCLKGIYRVSGVKSKVEKLCQSFENGAELVDLDGVHPNVISNVLKLYLRQLPEPLLTYRLYPEFVKVAKDHPSQKSETMFATVSVVDDLRKLVHRLPAVHFSTLACLMLHLHRVSQHADHNNMPPSNLGIVFGPTLLRTSEGSASLSSLVDTVHQTRVIELLVAFADEIFTSLPQHPQSAAIEDDCLRNNGCRGEKEALRRTISGSSQTTSELDDSHRRDGIVLTEDDSIPSGYSSAQHSHAMEISSDDLLYSVISDEDFPEMMLPVDSVFKKAGLLHPFCEAAVEEGGTKASLSSSPAISEASHCSSLLRSTDDESFPEASQLPVPPPRRHLNQSFLHTAFSDSSLASSQTTDVFTSTAVVTLAAGQQQKGSRTSVSSVTAELRRQFFDLPCPGGVSPPEGSRHHSEVSAGSELDAESTSFCGLCQEELCVCTASHSAVDTNTSQREIKTVLIDDAVSLKSDASLHHQNHPDIYKSTETTSSSQTEMTSRRQSESASTGSEKLSANRQPRFV